MSVTTNVNSEGIGGEALHGVRGTGGEAIRVSHTWTPFFGRVKSRGEQQHLYQIIPKSGNVKGLSERGHDCSKLKRRAREATLYGGKTAASRATCSTPNHAGLVCQKATRKRAHNPYCTHSEQSRYLKTEQAAPARLCRRIFASAVPLLSPLEFCFFAARTDIPLTRRALFCNPTRQQ